MTGRLIEADAVYKILESCEIKKDTYGSLLNDWDHGYNCGIERAESEIECAPTVDAVPVTRCKDCKWLDMSDPSGTVEPIGYRCKKVTRLWREPDDYCKGAERKEENE